MQNNQNRLPKYHRANINVKMGDIKNYLSLLNVIQEYRFINSEQIIALSKISRNNTYRKLQKLYHNKLVDRYFIQSFQNQFLRKFIYTLDHKGALALVENHPEKFNDIYYPKRARSVFLVEHTMMITKFRICLTLALEKCVNVKLTAWKQGKQLRDSLIKYQIKNNTIIPDGYFVIKNGNEEVHYFLEADRGTMTLTRFYDKIRRYRIFFSKNRNGLPSRFIVLTITPNQKRTENLRTIVINGDSEKRGSERFWFTDEGNYNVNEPVKIIKLIFDLGFIGSNKKKSLLV
jgi:hypothetical protein